MSSLNQKNRVQLSPEVVRMAQIRSNRQGVQFRQELARMVAEEAVMELDCELGLLLESQSMNQSDALAGALGVNDIVVNGHRLDVRAIDEDGEVVVARALVGSPYLSMGSLLVQLDGIHGGAVVGHINSGVWLKAEDGLRDADPIRVVAASHTANFDFAALMVDLTGRTVLNLPAAKLADVKKDVNDLLNDKGHLIVARQKQIFNYLCANWSEQTMAMVEAIGFNLPPARVTKVLLAAGRWNAAIEKASDRLAGSFTRLSKDEIRKQFMTTGERFGGEVKSPAFRKELLSGLAASELALSSIPAATAQSVLAKVLSGVSAAEAVKQLVKNAVAVDLALAIKQKRQANAGFMAATADEIGMAFHQLSLQPAYATHSAGDSGVESINEALALLEASDLAEKIKICDREMAEL